MLDQGMQLKCLLYMEQIAEQIQYDPYRFDADFVRKVSERLDSFSCQCPN